MTKKLTVLCLILAAVIFGYQNCGNKTVTQYGYGSEKSSTVYNATVKMITNGSVEGRVDLLKDKPLDGCQALIISSDPKTGEQKVFIPFRLDSQYLKDGLNLHIEGFINPEIVTTCMAGEVFEVTSVKPLQ